jgi:hypothetical protein
MGSLSEQRAQPRPYWMSGPLTPPPQCKGHGIITHKRISAPTVVLSPENPCRNAATSKSKLVEPHTFCKMPMI